MDKCLERLKRAYENYDTITLTDKDCKYILEAYGNKVRMIFLELNCPKCNDCETIEDAWNMLCEHIDAVKKRHLSTLPLEKEHNSD